MIALNALSQVASTLHLSTTSAAFSRVTAGPQVFRARLAGKSATQPKPVDVAFRDPQSATYSIRYYCAAVKSMVGEHRLRMPSRPILYRCAFDLTDRAVQHWREAFGAGQEEGHDTPFLFQTRAGAPIVQRIVRELGVNFRFVMHVSSEFHFLSQGGLKPGQTYTLELGVDDIVPAGEDRAVVLLGARILDEAGELQATNQDAFLVKDLDPEDVQRVGDARGEDAPSAEDLGLLKRGAPRLKGEFVSTTFDVAEDMGSTYGRVSGDPNAMHTTRLGAKLFGHERPFLQGFCTANCILEALTRSGAGLVEEMSIQFVRKVYTGQVIEIRHSHDRYEVLGDDGKVLARGTLRLAGIVHVHRWPSTSRPESSALAS